MAIKRRPVTAVNAKDPAWIIALWITIHGGDPAPKISAKKANEAAMAIIRALTAIWIRPRPRGAALGQ
jgi:hypothetical protein